MKDVIAGLETALIAKTDAGEALVSVASRVYRNADDMKPGAGLRWPLVVMDADEPQQLDVGVGSRHSHYTGVVTLYCVVRLDESATNPVDAAEQDATDLAANVERVLNGLRGLTDGTHPTGVWHHLTYERLPGDVLEAGPSAFSGFASFVVPIRCTFKFHRLRAVA